MKIRFQETSASPSEDLRWSQRIFVLAVAGIFLLTIYPFTPSLHRYPSLMDSFRLPGDLKGLGPLDIFLNILLFVPYGFGLAGLLCKRGKPTAAALGLALVAGLLFSYSVEFTQSLLPDRDSNWEDVATNSTGSLLGCFLFQFIGFGVLSSLRRAERSVQRFVTVKTAAVILALYFAGWFALSAHLQKRSSLDEWDATGILSVGGIVAPGAPRSWEGRIYDLKIWDQALPPDKVSILAAQSAFGSADWSSLAEYDFSGSAPFEDLRRSAPPLNWTGLKRAFSEQPHDQWDGAAWLSTGIPITATTSAIRNSGRFSIFVRCRPTAANDSVNANIVSISHPGRSLDFVARQQSSYLRVWFHTDVTTPPSQLRWSVENAFSAGRTTSLLISYDGAKLKVYLDGRLARESYELGAWAALAKAVRHGTIAEELGGYRYVYYSLIFFPSGAVLGLAWRNLNQNRFFLLALLTAGMLLPATLLEFILVHAGHQPVSFRAVLLSIFLCTFGWVWINLEGKCPDPAVGSAAEA